MNSNAEMMSPAPQAPSLGKSRLTLLAVFAFFAAPVIFAWLSFFVFEDLRPSGTTNNGELIQPPRFLEYAGLQDVSGAGNTAEFLQGKWTYVMWVGGGCDAACNERLYLMRQVRLAQGKNIDRVQRLMIAVDMDQQQLAELQEHYPGMAITGGTLAGVTSLQQQFAQDDIADVPSAGYLYLVDPMGNLMLRYAPGTEPKGIVKDLERLLRISYVG